MALPSGYRTLAYIKSSGTQYIDTGFQPNQNTRVVMDIQAIGTSETYFLFGARETYASRSFCFLYYNGWSADYQSSSQRQTFAGINYTDQLQIDFDKTTCTVNGRSVSFTAATFQSPVTMSLLAVNTNGTNSGMISAKLFSCKIYDNGTLVRDFVPAKRISDDTVGLYDIVNGAFYTNAGTGSFVGVIKTGPVDGVGATIVQATSYGIDGGKTIVNGTAYDITKGRTLIGGTGYDILFSKSCIVTISGTGSTTGNYLSYVVINGNTYTGYATVEVESGTTILCYVKSTTNTANIYEITAQGHTVVLAKGMDELVTASYVVEQDISISLSMSQFNTNVTITEADSIEKTITVTHAGDNSYVYFLTEDGTRIYSEGKYNFPVGSKLTLVVNGRQSNDNYQTSISVDGVTKWAGTGGVSGQYTYTVVSNATIFMYYRSSSQGYIQVTTE